MELKCEESEEYCWRPSGTTPLRTSTFGKKRDVSNYLGVVQHDERLFVFASQKRTPTNNTEHRRIQQIPAGKHQIPARKHRNKSSNSVHCYFCCNLCQFWARCHSSNSTFDSTIASTLLRHLLRYFFDNKGLCILTRLSGTQRALEWQ